MTSRPPHRCPEKRKRWSPSSSSLLTGYHGFSTKPSSQAPLPWEWGYSFCRVKFSPVFLFTLHCALAVQRIKWIPLNRAINQFPGELHYSLENKLFSDKTGIKLLINNDEHLVTETETSHIRLLCFGTFLG